MMRVPSLKNLEKMKKDYFYLFLTQDGVNDPAEQLSLNHTWQLQITVRSLVISCPREHTI
jgi:hypothetical protein